MLVFYSYIIKFNSQVIGKYLIAASENGSIYRYHWQSGTMQKEFKYHVKSITGLVVHNDSVYSSSLDGCLHKFDVEVKTILLLVFKTVY